MDDEKISGGQEDAFDDEEVKFESLYNRVQNMSISEKVKLASLGSKEARNLLIKEPNRLITQAVINSPKLTDDEVVSFAGNKNLTKEVPLLISNKKEFTKNYMVKVALVNNPKTPLPTAIKFLSHLMDKDLRSIAKSKNVPTVLSRTAGKMLINKGK